MAAEQRESGTDQEFLEHLRSLPSQHMRTLLWDQGVLTLWKPSLASPDLLLFLQGSRLKSSSLAMQSLGSGPWLKLSRWRSELSQPDRWLHVQNRTPIFSLISLSIFVSTDLLFESRSAPPAHGMGPHTSYKLKQEHAWELMGKSGLPED
jgi:hypothetical protein